MKVVRADEMGMCFGVKDALATAFRQPDPGRVTIHGELVHNGEVLRRLEERGFRMTSEDARDEAPPTPEVLITAHGISHAERRRLTGLGATLIDTTCPLVRRVHVAAQAFEDDGRFVVVIGRRGHVEVRGITGDLERFEVVPSEDEVRRYPSDRIGVVSQTTFRADEAATIVAAVRRANDGADVVFADTVCEPTRRRIGAVEQLAAVADAVVVVGGANSNNSRQLVRLCEAKGTRAVLVQGPDELDPAWFAGVGVVGLTAGTSTQDETINAVELALRGIG